MSIDSKVPGMNITDYVIPIMVSAMKTAFATESYLIGLLDTEDVELMNCVKNGKVTRHLEPTIQPPQSLFARIVNYVFGRSQPREQNLEIPVSRFNSQGF